jgi:hypothetical protein
MNDNENEIRRCSVCNTSIEDMPLNMNECKKCTDDKIKKKKEKSDNENDNESNNENEEEKRVKKKKHQKKEYLATLAGLVSKEYVDADEFREIVKRNAKSDEKISWTLRQEYLLKEIGEKSLCYYLLHRDESIRFKRAYDISMMYIFTQTMIASVLMFIASGFQGASEQSEQSDNNDSNSVPYIFVLPLASGMINLGIAFQQKVLEFKQPERFMIEHETTSRVFRGIYDDIRKELLLERKDRANMPGFLNVTYDRYITEKKKAPFISKIGYQTFRSRHLSSEGEFGVIDEENNNSVLNCCRWNSKEEYNTYDHSRYNHNNRDYFGGYMIDEYGSEEEKKIKIKSLKKQIMNSVPEDIIGFKLLNINENDIEFSKQKEQYEMNWELEYLKKKMKEKLKKVDKIVRNELDEEHYSDIDSVDLNEINKDTVSQFISNFYSLYARYPTKEEVEENLDISISEERINNEIRNQEIRINELRNQELKMQELLRNQQDILRKGMKDQEEIRDQEEIIVKEILMSQEKLDNTDNV